MADETGAPDRVHLWRFHQLGLTLLDQDHSYHSVGAQGVDHHHDHVGRTLGRRRPLALGGQARLAPLGQPAPGQQQHQRARHRAAPRHPQPSGAHHDPRHAHGQQQPGPAEQQPLPVVEGQAVAEVPDGLGPPVEVQEDHQHHQRPGGGEGPTGRAVEDPPEPQGQQRRGQHGHRRVAPGRLEDHAGPGQPVEGQPDAGARPDRHHRRGEVHGGLEGAPEGAEHEARGETGSERGEAHGRCGHRRLSSAASPRIPEAGRGTSDRTSERTPGTRGKGNIPRPAPGGLPPTPSPRGRCEAPPRRRRAC